VKEQIMVTQDPTSESSGGNPPICTSRSGWYDPARELLKRGHGPDTLLHVQHVGKPFDPTIVPQPIGELALWTVEETKAGGRWIYVHQAPRSTCLALRCLPTTRRAANDRRLPEPPRPLRSPSHPIHVEPQPARSRLQLRPLAATARVWADHDLCAVAILYEDTTTGEAWQVTLSPNAAIDFALAIARVAGELDAGDAP
jgi:hypothetical protein